MRLFILLWNSRFYTAAIKAQMTTDLMLPINPLIQLVSGGLWRSLQVPKPHLAVRKSTGQPKDAFSYSPGEGRSTTWVVTVTSGGPGAGARLDGREFGTERSLGR